MRRFMPFTPLHDALLNTGYLCFWESCAERKKRITPENEYPEDRFCFLPVPTRDGYGDGKWGGGEVGSFALYAFVERAERKRFVITAEATDGELTVEKVA